MQVRTTRCHWWDHLQEAREGPRNLLYRAHGWNSLCLGRTKPRFSHRRQRKWRAKCPPHRQRNRCTAFYSFIYRCVRWRPLPQDLNAGRHSPAANYCVWCFQDLCRTDGWVLRQKIWHRLPLNPLPRNNLFQEVRFQRHYWLLYRDLLPRPREPILQVLARERLGSPHDVHRRLHRSNYLVPKGRQGKVNQVDL